MFLGLDVEVLNAYEMQGAAGGVSLFIENEGKRIVKRFSDMSYLWINPDLSVYTGTKKFDFFPFTSGYMEK